MAFDSEGTPTTVLPGEAQTTFYRSQSGVHGHVPSETPQEGDPFTWSIKTSKGPLVIVNYYLPRGAYKESLEKAGFEKIKFHPFELDPKSEGLGKNFAISPFSHLEDADSNDKKEFYKSFWIIHPRFASSVGRAAGSDRENTQCRKIFATERKKKPGVSQETFHFSTHKIQSCTKSSLQNKT